jgi:hypothetical protein
MDGSETGSDLRKLKVGAKGAEAPNPDEEEVEKTFWLSRPDSFVINRKRIILLEFKRWEQIGSIHPSWRV